MGDDDGAMVYSALLRDGYGTYRVGPYFTAQAARLQGLREARKAGEGTRVVSVDSSPTTWTPFSAGAPASAHPENRPAGQPDTVKA